MGVLRFQPTLEAQHLSDGQLSFWFWEPGTISAPTVPVFSRRVMDHIYNQRGELEREWGEEDIVRIQGSAGEVEEEARDQRHSPKARGYSYQCYLNEPGPPAGSRYSAHSWGQGRASELQGRAML